MQVVGSVPSSRRRSLGTRAETPPPPGPGVSPTQSGRCHASGAFDSRRSSLWSRDRRFHAPPVAASPRLPTFPIANAVTARLSLWFGANTPGLFQGGRRCLCFRDGGTRSASRSKNSNGVSSTTPLAPGRVDFRPRRVARGLFRPVEVGTDVEHRLVVIIKANQSVTGHLQVVGHPDRDRRDGGEHGHVQPVEPLRA